MFKVLSVKCVRSRLEDHNKGLEVSGLSNHLLTGEKLQKKMRTHEQGTMHVTASKVALGSEMSLRQGTIAETDRR